MPSEPVNLTDAAWEALREIDRLSDGDPFIASPPVCNELQQAGLIEVATVLLDAGREALAASQETER